MTRTGGVAVKIAHNSVQSTASPSEPRKRDVSEGHRPIRERAWIRTLADGAVPSCDENRIPDVVDGDVVIRDVTD